MNLLFKELLGISGCFQTFEKNTSRICDNRALSKSESLRSAPAAEAESPRVRCPGFYPAVFWISPRIETLPPPWAIQASAWSPSPWKSVSWYSDKTSSVSMDAHCLWSCHWVPLKRACLLHSFLPGIYESTLKLSHHYGKCRERYHGESWPSPQRAQWTRSCLWIPEVDQK